MCLKHLSCARARPGAAYPLIPAPQPSFSAPPSQLQFGRPHALLNMSEAYTAVSSYPLTPLPLYPFSPFFLFLPFRATT
jgi:hypothetical protein